jgi:hypothetical protein
MKGGVKGTAIESVVADVVRLLEAGRISREDLEVRLEREDLELLEQKLLPSLWYGFGPYGRMMQLLLDVEGHGSVEYLVERGRRAAERLRRAGLYAQLDADRARWGDRLGQMMVSLGPALYRDTTWRFRLGDAGARYEIEVDVPVSFPDVCRHATQGFIEHVSTHASGAPVRVTSERVAATRMLFRAEPIRG